MSSTFSIAARPVGVGNGKREFCKRPLVIRATRSGGVTMAPREMSTVILPELSKQGTPHTDLYVREIVERQSQQACLFGKEDACRRKPEFHPSFLEEAYERCRNICAEYAKTFYLGPISLPFFPTISTIGNGLLMNS